MLLLKERMMGNKNWGFLELKAKAYNQHTATVVALVLKAKAQPKQRPKQSSHNKTIKTEQTFKQWFDNLT